MNLENRLLVALGDYDRHLAALALVRQTVGTRPSTENRVLFDEVIKRYLAEEMEAILPRDRSDDRRALESLSRQKELWEVLRAQGYDGTDTESLLAYLVGWAAACQYSNWGMLPWHRLCTTIIDEHE